MTDETPTTRSLIADGFTCEAVDNGGWIVRRLRPDPARGNTRPVLGAFSGVLDMLQYIDDELLPEERRHAMPMTQAVFEARQAESIGRMEP